MLRNASEGVIRVSQRNPHYYEYKGKEILLITSAEHYGAVINVKFDYVKYLDTLSEYGLNYTRIYPGTSLESPGRWKPEDNMTGEADTLVPWARSSVPGYYGGGNKFDLNQWDPAYFERLRLFLGEAEKRGIIVEICFFNCTYAEFWPYVPLQKDNNIQGVGDCEFNMFQSLDNGPLVKEQLRYIEKLIIETNDFDNILYEFVDEPTLFLAPSHKAYHWISKLVDKAVETERGLPKNHMLAQQLELGIDFNDDDRVSVIVTQYIRSNARQIGGIIALDNCYAYNKPIELNETAWIDAWIKEGTHDAPAITRLESWEFMVGGGAAYNQLNGYFVATNPAGDNATSHKLLGGLKLLREFLEGFDYSKMTRDIEFVKKTSVGAVVNVISEKGKQYAVYLHHSFPSLEHHGIFYEPNRGEYATKLTVHLEPGNYRVSFVEPETLNVLGEQSITVTGGDTEICCPGYDLDIALKIMAVA